jgi:hypothetical protein
MMRSLYFAEQTEISASYVLPMYAARLLQWWYGRHFDTARVLGNDQMTTAPCEHEILEQCTTLVQH